MQIGRTTSLVVVLLVLLSAGAGLVVPSQRAAAARQPNIVMILTDDQDFRSLEQMRGVRAALTTKGTTFPNFVVSTPGCCPSRASILRGQYTHNHRVFFSDPPNGGVEAFREQGHEQSTVATWLKAAGYRTALVGKYLNGYGEDDRETAVPPGWNEWYTSTSLKYFKYQMVENGRLVDYGDDPDDYLTDVLSGKAQDFVRRAAKDDEPFFLYLAPRAPHGPATPAPRHANALPNAKVPRVQSFNERDVSDKPSFVREAPRLNPDQIEKIDALYQDRMRTLLAVDEMVTNLIATLKATNELDHTYIFFASDNGYLQGEHRRTEKGMAYEEAIRFPLLVRGPGVRAGVVDKRVVSNIDLAPTFVDLAGGATPGFVDGRSLVPPLSGEATGSWRQAALVQAFGRSETTARFVTLSEVGNRPTAPPFRALRMEDRVYIEYARTEERELYDLRADPYQLKNLAASADPAELERLSAWLVALVGCGPDGPMTCTDAENAPPVGEDVTANRDFAGYDARAGAPPRG